ncbi:hypothetical protein J2783_001829 [Chryseobacterium sediminis]|nr:hypothetical protein [Chryseobacterium sediminis]
MQIKYLMYNLLMGNRNPSVKTENRPTKVERLVY